jgi:hypothetical protein
VHAGISADEQPGPARVRGSEGRREDRQRLALPALVPIAVLSWSMISEAAPGQHCSTVPLLAALATAGMALALATGAAATALVEFAALGAGISLVVPALFSAAARLPVLGPGAGITAVATFGWAGFVCGPPLIGGLAGIGGLRAALTVIPALTLVIALATTRVSVPSNTNTRPQT